MARIDSIFKSDTKKAEQHPKRITKWIHYTKLHDNKDQYCNAPDKEAIEALADLIEADGEVLQDLLVRKIDTDEYEIVAGHKRRQACRLLVEERGKQEFAFLPCYIKNESDVRSEFRLYSTNGYHEKTEYEKMHELERMKYLLENYPEEFPQVQTGRMVERLAKLLNMKKTTVGEYLTIAKNLGDKGMEKFRSGEIKKSAAVELSGLPEEEQDHLIDQGITTHTQIKQLKCERKQTEPERQKEIIEQMIDTEENPIDEKYNLSDMPQAKEKYVKALANVLVQERGALLKSCTEEAAKLQLKCLVDNQSGQIIRLSDGTEVSAGETIIEFWRGKEDLGVCSYNRFATQVLGILDQKKNADIEKENLNLKNNEQRKEWLRNYKAWGVWYTDENIGCTYYKYDFANGACLIAETYQVPATRWYEAHEAYYLHLVGGPEPPRDRTGMGKWERHSVYTKDPDSETMLVEFLKYVQ